MAKRETRAGRGAAASLIPLILAMGAAGCDSVLNTDRELAERAYLTVEGTSPVQLELITSTDFVGVRDPDTNQLTIRLLAADTTLVDLPVNSSYDITSGARFFVRLTNPTLEQTASVHMRVTLDGDEVYNVTATLRDASLEYTFNYF